MKAMRLRAQIMQWWHKHWHWEVAGGFGALALVAIGVGVWHVTHQAVQPAQQPKASQPAHTQSATAPPQFQDPIQIGAIRARQYPGSVLTIEQNLGSQGGYTNFIASYQSDGYKIYALLALPDSAAPAGGWPVIILNHGYINPADYQTNGSDYRSWIATIARAGFAVIKPDYRGNGQSQGPPAGGHFAPDYAYDDLNLIATLKQYSAVNPKRIGVLGHSLGGHVTLRADVVSPDIRASAFVNGVVGSFNDIFYNWPHSPAPHDQPTGLVQGARQALISKFGTPNSNPDFWNSASAINFVQYVAGPVQVNSDSNDSVVPKLFSDHLVAALQAAHKPVEYNSYPGDDHQMSSLANHAALMSNLVRFFKANL